MRVLVGSVDPEGIPRLTVSSRVISLVESSRQPSGTNVFGGVHVAVVTGLTSRTGPRSNRQRLAFGDVAAFRTAFSGRKPSVDFDHSAPSLFGFVLNHTDERGPTSVADRSRQISVLLHSLHVQALQSDDLVLVNDSPREFVKKVFSFVFDLSVDPRHALLLLLPVLRPLLLAREAFLRLTKTIEIIFQILRVTRLETVRGDNHVSYAEINADRLPVAVIVGHSWLWLRVRHRTSDTHEVPTCRVFRQCDGGRFRLIRQSAAPSDVQTSRDFGNRQLFAVQREGIRSKTSSLLVVLRLEVGIPTAPVEEVLERLIEVAELLLKCYARNLAEPRFLFLEIGQTPSGIGVAQAFAFFVIGIRPKLQSPVPHVSGVPEDFGEDRLLFFGRVKTILETLLLSHSTYRKTGGSCKFRDRSNLFSLRSARRSFPLTHI